jgi:DNA topoisomerase II
MAKKIEDKYKVLTQIEHVLLRPQTYVGSNKQNTDTKYIIEDDKVIEKEITYIPSFIKIFDEVITNSVDEHQRNKKLNKIDVIVDVDNNLISIKDNGGIPCEIHKEHNQYVPEVIFGNLMSGSNYDDTDERTVAGLNGLGAKLTNIFSTEFTVTTCDGKKQFIQTFTKNMSERSKPKVKAIKSSYTEIKYKPDLKQFGLDKIDEDHFKMIEKRVYDLAGSNPNINFTFNKKSINFKSFEDYIKMYVDDFFYETNKKSDWSIGIALSENGFQQVSFANSTETYDGGTHVDYIMNQIISELREYFNKKHKVDIKPSELKNHMFLFLNSTIINPSFSSQTKEKLITEVREFGYEFIVSKKLIQSILKSDIVNSILDWIDQKKKAEENKIQRELNKKLSKIKVEKLIDSKGKERWNSKLLIFEGDCLSENTEVRVLRDGDLINAKMKELNIGDLVITHKNRFCEIVALTRNIQKKNTIKTNIGNIDCSLNHKFWVYDITKNEFYFEKISNIDKTKHKLVKNQLCFMESLLEIESISYNTIKLKSGQLFNISRDHKLCVYDRNDGKFKMVEFGIIKDIKNYLIVNTFSI